MRCPNECCRPRSNKVDKVDGLGKRKRVVLCDDDDDEKPGQSVRVVAATSERPKKTLWVWVKSASARVRKRSIKQIEFDEFPLY